jgi:hypothetical protein
MTVEAPQQRPPRVFVSYGNDSPEHQDLLRSLADRLRQDGVDAVVDLYEPAPPDGWPIWMDLQIQKADFVLLVCTDTYLRRVERREKPGEGRGVLWETKLIYNHLYEADAPVQKFIPILLEGGETSHIPTPLRALTHYSPSTEEGYENLYRYLTNQPRRQIPELGKLKTLPARQPQSHPPWPEVRTERKSGAVRTPPQIQVANSVNLLAQSLNAATTMLIAARDNGKLSQVDLNSAFSVFTILSVTGKQINAELRSTDSWDIQKGNILRVITGLTAVTSKLPPNAKAIIQVSLAFFNEISLGVGGRSY